MLRRALVGVAMLLVGYLAIRAVALVGAHDGAALYDGDVDAQRALARGMDRWVDDELGREAFSTGSSRFDGEWLFATRMMAVLGYAQVAMEQPSLREAHAARIDACVDALISEEGRAFDREAWGSDPFDDLGSPRAHVAYLGYLSLALVLARAVNPETRHRALEEAVVAHLVVRFERAELGLLETYPREVFPIDNTSFFGAIALHDRLTGEDHRALRERLLATLFSRYRDPRSGLLYQLVDPNDGTPIDRPRGSGTALAAYYLSFADAARSLALYDAMRTHLVRSHLGFGTTREYLPGEGGFGDVDSGPVIFGQGVGVTGFTLASARAHGDREVFVRTYATAWLFGGPVDADGTHYALGGPLGDALLFALTTALPPERWAALGPGGESR